MKQFFKVKPFRRYQALKQNIRWRYSVLVLPGTNGSDSLIRTSLGGAKRADEERKDPAFICPARVLGAAVVFLTVKSRVRVTRRFRNSLAKNYLYDSLLRKSRQKKLVATNLFMEGQFAKFVTYSESHGKMNRHCNFLEEEYLCRQILQS